MVSMEKDMDEKQQTDEYQQTDKHFLSLLFELQAVKNKYVVAEQLNWYEKNTWQPRFFFSLSGILIIVLSVSIPYLSTLEGPWKNIVLPIVALVVAGLTGLSAFFRWDSKLKSYIQTKYRLQYCLSIWELEIAEAKHELKPEIAMKKALQATRQLLKNAQNITSSETEEHFQKITIPEPSKVQ
jgi:hypothetical protein